MKHTFVTATCAVASIGVFALQPALAGGFPAGYKDPDVVEKTTHDTRQHIDLPGENSVRAPAPPQDFTPRENLATVPQPTPETLEPAQTLDRESESFQPRIRPSRNVLDRQIAQEKTKGGFLSFSIGFFNSDGSEDDAAAVEVAWEPRVAPGSIIQPIFGGLINSDGAGYAYAGLGVPFQISERIRFMPSFAVAAYSEGGGPDLGEVLSYRAAAELGYRLKNDHWLGLRGQLISTGDFLDTDDTAGVVSVTYAMPFAVQ